MRTLHPAYRVTSLAASLDFYTALGYEQVGRVDIGEGTTLAMLKFQNDEVVTLELVHRTADGPVDIGTGFSHLAVQVDNLSATIEALSKAGLRPGRWNDPAVPMEPKPPGWRIRTVIGSSWCSGRLGTPTE